MPNKNIPLVGQIRKDRSGKMFEITSITKAWLFYKEYPAKPNQIAIPISHEVMLNLDIVEGKKGKPAGIQI